MLQIAIGVDALASRYAHMIVAGGDCINDPSDDAVINSLFRPHAHHLEIEAIHIVARHELIARELGTSRLDIEALARRGETRISSQRLRGEGSLSIRIEAPAANVLGAEDGGRLEGGFEPYKDFVGGDLFDGIALNECVARDRYRSAAGHSR
jgi:hypothetical protein